jgi:2'-5' RNA ligase
MLDEKDESHATRLFFGGEVKAAWPQELPPGRLIPEETRHITLAFLGQSTLRPAQFLHIPKPSFVIGPAGIGSQWLFLPKNQTRVVALDMTWLEDPHPLFAYQEILVAWLLQADQVVRKRSFLPHITLARMPFEKKAWEEAFFPIPFFLSAIQLYESLGHLEYRILWSYPLQRPFTELEHTADLAFEICGASLNQLCVNAQLALFFTFPPLAQYYTPSSVHTLDALVIELNRMVTLCDAEHGCPFKAVSFHGRIEERNGLNFWKMIVDV